MKTYFILFINCMSAIFVSCKKDETIITTNDKPFAEIARNFYERNVNAIAISKNHKNDLIQNKSRIQLFKNPVWAKAYTAYFSGVKGIVVPILYDNPIVIKSNFGGRNVYSINELSKLFVYQDHVKEFHAEIITAFPDSTYKSARGERFKGILFVEDLNGNLIHRYQYFQNGDIKKDRNLNRNSPDLPASSLLNSSATADPSKSSREITVCYSIEGYNYSVSSPDSGYYYSEPAGCQTYFIPDGSILTSYGGGGYGGGTPYPSEYGTIPTSSVDSGMASVINPSVEYSVLGGSSNINNVLDYNKCFDNIPGSDHLYEVKVCVSQPEPGSRDPWGFSSFSNLTATGNPIFVGHTFLVLTEVTPNKTVTRNIGFYPKNSASPLFPSDQGQLNNDELHDYDISLSINVYSSQFTMILNFIAQANTPKFQYDLNSNNCTTFVVNAIATTGIILPRTFGSWARGGGLNPGDLAEDIKVMKLAPNMTRTSITGSHINKGECN